MSSDENDERLITNVEELMRTVTGLTSDLDKVTRWASEASRALDLVTKQYADSSDSDKTLVSTLEIIKEHLDKMAEANSICAHGKKAIAVLNELYDDKGAAGAIEMSGLIERTIPRQKAIDREERRSRRDFRNMKQRLVMAGWGDALSKSVTLSAISAVISFK